MAIVDRKRTSDETQAASQLKQDQPFAEIDAKKLGRARKDPRIQTLLTAADDHMATLRAEGRID